MIENKDSEWRILDTRTVHEGWARLLVATIRLPDGRAIKREIEDHGSAVAVLAYNPQRKTAVLVRQFRAPAFFADGTESTLEVIAGIIEDEDAAACARRESIEEAHLELDSLEHVLTGWTMPGISAERMHFYLATYSGAERAEISGGVASEDESTVACEIDLAELARMADAAALTDVKTLLLLQTLRLRRPDLF